VLRVVVSGVAPESIRPYRGWGDDEWAGAIEQLQARGYLDGSGEPSDAGRNAHRSVEALTDRLASAPADALDLEALDELLQPMRQAVATSGLIPYPNPMGVPPPPP
jgi:hypothetical protein